MPPIQPAALLAALQQAEVGALTGTVWRQVLVPTNVLRPNVLGARWNRPGTEALSGPCCATHHRVALPSRPANDLGGTTPRTGDGLVSDFRFQPDAESGGQAIGGG